jgi:hypothetical protein
MANSPAHLYSTYVKAFNVRDVEAFLACCELTRLLSQGQAGSLAGVLN